MGNQPVFGDCTSAAAFVLNEQPEGFWTFTVRATDKAGNFAQQARDIKIDGTPPETTILDGPEDGETVGEGTLTWDLEANENATFECRIAPAAFAPCSGEARHVVSGLAPGTYTFEARATDLTGNVDPTPVHSTFTVDRRRRGAPVPPRPGGSSLVTERVSDPEAAPDRGRPQLQLHGGAQRHQALPLPRQGIPGGRDGRREMPERMRAQDLPQGQAQGRPAPADPRHQEEARRSGRRSP